MKTQRGFTLIELVVVIIILGVLAAVAVPKFIDMSTQAHTAAAKGVAGALASSSSINFAAKSAGVATAQTVNNTCTNAATITALNAMVSGVTLQTGASGADDVFMIAGAGDCSGATTSSMACTITPNGGGSAATATIVCAR